ncbi:uncharacterized protein LOC142358649 [Convolutriloba macropyga]|uniref:uncharacterized protein LOC142358649 n=1 Tax=Convolutriloba macropyga TaxID=536237 RepID=UPI003F528874
MQYQLNHRSLSDLVIYSFKFCTILFILTNVVHGCHEFCSCTMENKTITADCQFRHIREIPSIEKSWGAKLGNLLLAGNSLTSLKSNDLDEYKYLRILQLSFNKIDYIDDHAFENLQSIELINLDYNSLSDLSVYSFLNVQPQSRTPSRKLFITIFHNPIVCSCALNAKLNTIKNKNSKIEQFFITCFENNDDVISSVPIQVEKFAEQNCKNVDENFDHVYTLPTTKYVPPIPIPKPNDNFKPNEFAVDSGIMVTQVTNPPLKTSQDPLMGTGNNTSLYPSLNLESGQITIKLWHLILLIGTAILISVLVILICYLSISRLCTLSESGGRKSTSPGRSSYLSNGNIQEHQFATLNSIHTNQSNGYVHSGLYDNIPMNSTAYSTLSRNHYGSDFRLSTEMHRRSRNSSQNSTNGNMLFSTDTVPAPTCSNIEDFPDFSGSREKLRNTPNGNYESKLGNGKLPDFSDVGDSKYIRANKNNEVFFLDQEDPNCKFSSNYVNFTPRDSYSEW